MSQNDPQQKLVAGLVAQDPEINEATLRENYMDIEKSLLKWERDGRVVRRAAWIAVGVLLATYLLAIPLSRTSNFAGKEFVMFMWSFVGILSLLLALLFTALYNARYAPRITRARFDLQLAMLHDLQRQVDELRKTSSPFDKNVALTRMTSCHA